MTELDKFPKPSVTVDLVLMSVSDASLTALLQKRTSSPFKGRWALPGGFVQIDESLDQAAERILADKARMEGAWIEQLYTFGSPRRDPRGRVITVAYFALLPHHQLAQARHKAVDLTIAKLDIPWPGEEGDPVTAHGDNAKPLSLAFDHADVLTMAIKRLRGKLDYSKVAFALLPDRFTLRQLQHVHETILGQSLNKPAFRRRMLDTGWLEATGQRETGTGFRPAELFRLKPGKTPDTAP